MTLRFFFLNIYKKNMNKSNLTFLYMSIITITVDPTNNNTDNLFMKCYKCKTFVNAFPYKKAS